MGELRDIDIRLIRVNQRLGIEDKVSQSLMQKQEKDITIRPLHPNDVAAIYVLLQNSTMAGNLPYVPSMELSPISEWLAKRELGVHRYVADADGELIGFLMLTHKMRPRLNHTGTLTMAVHSTILSTEARRALVTAALDLADNWLNLSRIELELSTESKMDVDYFQSVGFEIEGTRVMATYRDGKWIDQHVLARLRINPVWLDKPERPTTSRSVSRPDRVQHQIHNIEIRPADIGDANAFYDMLRDPAICRTTLQLPSQEIWQTEERLNSSSNWIHRFSAVADGEIVGSIVLAEDRSPGHGHIARIAMKVHSDYWGHGIGSKLMKSVTDLADNWLNVVRIELDVNTDNPAGIQLYKNSGFAIEGKKRFHGYGDGRWADSYFMARIQKN